LGLWGEVVVPMVIQGFVAFGFVVVLCLIARRRDCARGGLAVVDLSLDLLRP